MSKRDIYVNRRYFDEDLSDPNGLILRLLDTLIHEIRHRGFEGEDDDVLTDTEHKEFAPAASTLRRKFAQDPDRDFEGYMEACMEDDC